MTKQSLRSTCLNSTFLFPNGRFLHHLPCLMIIKRIRYSHIVNHLQFQKCTNKHPIHSPTPAQPPSKLHSTAQLVIVFILAESTNHRAQTCIFPIKASLTTYFFPTSLFRVPLDPSLAPHSPEFLYGLFQLFKGSAQ